MSTEHIQAIIDQHNAVLGNVRDASTAFDRALAALRDVLSAIAEANHKQGAAIDSVIAANQSVLRLLREQN